MNFTITKFYQLMSDPLVFIIATGWNFSSGIFLCLKEAKGRPCHVLVQCYWDGADLVHSALAFKHQAARHYPNLQLTYLCNTLADAQLFQSKGIEALHIHQNAFIDERICRTDPDVSKIYSAAHTANVQSFKRHHLAWNVSGIVVITYDPAEQNNFVELVGYKNLGFINRSKDGNIYTLSRAEVGAILHQSKCGLILSEKEGANFASAEYLLSGIPVVSTPSVGGRDEFFDPRHVKIVEPNAEAVERAVAEWVLNPPPSAEIRESVLVKCREHRRRLLGFLAAISNKNVFSDIDENFWSPLFVDKLTDTVPIGPTDNIPLWSHPKWRWRVYKKLRSYFR